MDASDDLEVDVAKSTGGEPEPRRASIQAFPTLRFFKDGKQYGLDYRQTGRCRPYGVPQTKGRAREDDGGLAPRRKQRMLETRTPRLHGLRYVLVNACRATSTSRLEVYITTSTRDDEFDHVVNHLSFGTPLASSTERKLSKYAQFQANYPLDGGRFISPDFHQAHHHYSKVVSTHFQVGGLMSKMRDVIRYQTLVQSQVMHYSEMDVPEAKFAYDLSPMAVVVSSKGRRWYDFVTSVCAIVGGTFTVLGLVDGMAAQDEGRQAIEIARSQDLVNTGCAASSSSRASAALLKISLGLEPPRLVLRHRPLD